jgi:hypothetical protein
MGTRDQVNADTRRATCPSRALPRPRRNGALVDKNSVRRLTANPGELPPLRPRAQGCLA